MDSQIDVYANNQVAGATYVPILENLSPLPNSPSTLGFLTVEERSLLIRRVSRSIESLTSKFIPALQHLLSDLYQFTYESRFVSPLVQEIQAIIHSLLDLQVNNIMHTTSFHTQMEGEDRLERLPPVVMSYKKLSQEFALLEERIRRLEIQQLHRSNASIHHYETIPDTPEPTRCCGPLRRFQTQMDTNPTGVQSQETTAGFDDKNDVIEQENEYEEEEAYNPWDDIELNTFLKRSYLIKTIMWDPGMTYSSQVAQFYPLEELYSIMAEKLDQVAYWAPDIEITIRSNACISDYGALLWHWDYSTNRSNQRYDTWAAARTSPNMIVTTAGTQMTYRFTIPFAWHSKQILVYADAQFPRTYKPFVNAWVLNPILNAAPGGASGSIAITVYAAFKETRLAGILPPGYSRIPLGNRRFYTQMPGRMSQRKTTTSNSGSRNTATGGTFFSKASNVAKDVAKHAGTVFESAQNATGNMEAQRVSDEGTLKPSNIANAVGDFAAGLSVIPIVGDFAGPISMVAKGASKVLSWFGWAVPANLNAESPVFKRPQRMYRIEDLVPTNAIGFVPDNTIQKDFKTVHGDISETSFTFLAQMPMLSDSLVIPATSPIGDELFVLGLQPKQFGFLIPHPTAGRAMQPSGFSALAERFYYIRGSVRIGIQVVCSPFHSIRLRFSYVPNGGVLPTWEDTQFIAQQTSEVTSTTDFMYVVPMMSDNDWVQTNETYGVFMIHNASDTCTLPGALGSYYINIFLSAGSDVQFSEYTTESRMVAASQYKPPTTFHTQMDTNDLVGGVATKYPTATAKGIAQASYQPLGMSGQGIKVSSVNTPHEFNSVKQFFNMSQPVYKLVGNANDYYEFSLPSRFWNHRNNLVGKLPTDLDYFSQCYRFQRGGIRWQISGAGTHYATDITGSYNDVLISEFFAFSTPTWRPDFTRRLEKCMLFTMPDARDYKLDFTMPYNNKSMCYSNIFIDFPSYIKTLFLYFKCTVKTDDATPLFLNLSGADDFIVGGYKGFEPYVLLKNTFPPTIIPFPAQNHRKSKYSQEPYTVGTPFNLEFPPPPVDSEELGPEPSTTPKPPVTAAPPNTPTTTTEDVHFPSTTTIEQTTTTTTEEVVTSMVPGMVAMRVFPGMKTPAMPPPSRPNTLPVTGATLLQKLAKGR